MQALKAAYLATGTVKNVVVISSKMSKTSKPSPPRNPAIDQKIESDRYRLMVRKTLSTMHLLQTMLKRILESKNQNLIDDINEHRIVEKLEYVEKWVGDHDGRKFNTLTETEKAQLRFVIDETSFVYDQLKSLIMIHSIPQPESIRL